MKAKTKRTDDLEHLHLHVPAREEAETWTGAKEDEAFQTEMKAIARDFRGVETQPPSTGVRSPLGAGQGDSPRGPPGPRA